MTQHFAVGRPVPVRDIKVELLPANGHLCDKEGGWMPDPVSSCFWCRDRVSERIDQEAAIDIDAVHDKRNVFVGRRRVDHVWIIATIILSFVVSMKAPDWPSLPTPPHCAAGVR